MDLYILVAIAICLVTFILSLIIILKKRAPQKDNGEQEHRVAPNRLRPGVPRRAQMARNRGARMVAGALAAQQAQDENDEAEVIDEDQDVNLDISDKVGAKKRAKLEAKAEKKAAREAEQLQREERKKKAELEIEERKQVEEKEHAEEKQKEEEMRKALEEKERREHEEYLKMKEAFSVEEEGYEEDEIDEQNLLTQFLTYIKQHKVVVIEDLASQFKLKTQAAIDRIKDLQNDDILTGVIDDRGKFIYVSQQEMEAVAKFIRQRGRVSIAELAENSNQLINLMSTIVK